MINIFINNNINKEIYIYYFKNINLLRKLNILYKYFLLIKILYKLKRFLLL